MPIKKNVRKAPPRVRAALDSIGKEKGVMAACVKVYSAADLEAGRLNHLGITLDSTGLHLPAEIIPLPKGKYSFRNRFGMEIIRRDLPQETHYTSVETPNWGDEATYGTHTVNLPYKKYPRDFIGPAQVAIRVDASNTNPGLAKYVIRFRLSEVLDRAANTFEERLLAGLNILQEQLGFCNVHSADSPLSDYVSSLDVSWEILPPGSVEETVDRVFRGRRPSEKERGVIRDRYEFLTALRPQNMVYGTSGFERYFGAMIRPDLVLFENVEYGNAIYVMFGSWETHSRLSRVELLSGRFGSDFERVVHDAGWKERVASIIERRLAEAT